MPLTLAALSQFLNTRPGVKHYRVAFSGGMDSMVLLHSMSSLRAQGAEWLLTAVHVHHGLHVEADQWQQFCEHTCRSLDVPCHVMQVDASPVTGESPEATARHLRYQAMSDVMQDDEVLLTAHHQDDQAETLLLQLFRGSGVPGLAAMPAQISFSNGLLVRPFLDYSRQQLLDYATHNQLEWVDDSSNRDHRYDRNYLRHDILPLLSQRWPGLAKTLSRSAVHMADADYCLDELAKLDLLSVTTEQKGTLNIDGLLALDERRLHNLLRVWLRDLGLAVPSQRQMQHIVNDVIQAGAEANPCVRWPGVEVRRYRQQLYAFAGMAGDLVSQRLDWNPVNSLLIAGVGRLRLSTTDGGGLSPTLLQSDDLHIGFRQGGERVRPAHRGHQHELKKLFQEAGVPPWERDRTPILYQGDEIVSIAGLCDSDAYIASQDQQGLSLEWDKCFAEAFI